MACRSVIIYVDDSARPRVAPARMGPQLILLVVVVAASESTPGAATFLLFTSTYRPILLSPVPQDPSYRTGYSAITKINAMVYLFVKNLENSLFI